MLKLKPHKLQEIWLVSFNFMKFFIDPQNTNAVDIEGVEETMSGHRRRNFYQLLTI